MVSGAGKYRCNERCRVEAVRPLILNTPFYQVYSVDTPNDFITVDDVKWGLSGKRWSVEVDL